MRVFLVDFENVKSDGLRCVNCLEEGDQVITFFSKNAESLSMDTYFNLVGSKASFYAVRLDRTGSNALDFQLVAYLGYLMGTPEHQDVYVISKDHGFYSAATFCRNFLIPQSKYKKTVTQYPSIASLFPNYVESRPAAINSIPLFMKGEPAVVEPQPIVEVQPVVELPQAEEAAVPTVEAPKAEEVHAAPVAPKRREVRVGKSAEKEQKPVETKPEEAKPVVTKPEERKPAEQKAAENKPRSDWDEISAAAEVGLQVIDMFGSAAPVKKETKVQKAVKKAEKPAVKQDGEIEIIDLFAKVEAPKAQKPVEAKPVEAAVVEVTPVEQAPKAEEAAAAPEVKEEKPVTEQENPLSGAEIDRMLEEFLEEAAAVIEENLRSMPQAEQLSEFIEVGEAKAQEKPVEASKEAPAEQPKAQTERVQRKRNTTRKAKQPSEVKEEAKPVEAQPKKEEAAAQEKPAPKKAERQPKKQAAEPKPTEKPAQTAEEKAEEKPTAFEKTPAVRQQVKNVLVKTLEIEEEAKDDLEKLIDCIIDASGKQDLYRMIIKLFGQKTGLEYYKVVKREYTNICNQIGKK